MIINSSNLHEFICNLPPGVMFFDNLLNLIDNKKEFSFIIKEEDGYLGNISKYPNVELISGAFKIKDVLLIVFLIKFNDNPDVLYETFLNIHSDSNKDTLKVISEQDYINIILFNESNSIHRSIRLNNNIREKMKQLNTMSTDYIPWTMEEFDIAKEIVLKQNNDSFKFWDYLYQRG